MKNEDTFNVHLAFIVNTALIVGFLSLVSLGSSADWFQPLPIGNASTPLSSDSTLLQSR
ncbi:MAG TPA: hypothetical protein V6D14_22485 [Coleofasciculaceae cyanobacterium]|jgi:hypothetical protein